MLGLPDAGLATYSDMVGRAEMICSVVGTPLIADADTGYGGLLNVQRTVRGYEAAASPRSRSRTRRRPRSAAICGPPRRAGRGDGAQDQGGRRGATASRDE